MIPKIIHQIWLQGYDQMPLNLKTFNTGCQYINDDFTHWFWTEDRIKKLLRKKFDKKYLELFDYYQIPAQKADFARYCILYVYGGIYLDMDTVCKKNLNKFLDCKFFFTSTNDLLNKLYRRYQTGIIGSVPKHGIFTIMFKKMFERVPYAKSLTYSTGTRLFYDSIKEYRSINEYIESNSTDIKIIDPKFLHPCGIFDDELCECACDDCYIVHTNYSSWSPFIKLTKYVVKHLKLILILLVATIVIVICDRKFIGQ